MTHYLVEKLKAGDPLEDAYDGVKSLVPEYVQRKFPGTTQKPVLVNHTTPPVWLRP